MKSKENVLIYGCGDMGIQAYNILKHDKTKNIIGFLDDNTSLRGSFFMGFPVFGDQNEIQDLKKKYQINSGIATIGNNEIRKRKNLELKNNGLKIISAIHPNSFIDNPKTIGFGTIVEMGAFIHPEVKIGNGCFICCGAIVAHNSNVGDYVLLAGGVTFGSRVNIGQFSLIGVGSNISPYISIGKKVMVGAGACVISDLPDNVIAVGVPAKIIKQNN